ncbi:Anoctamin-10 [Perkinsus olseni]|uniref:Anoctamin-10 n=1 Tax=Perkinsus olseni TaxID=32597 RepID=A0A7J6T276_PEROL|nr:Anoctamin-10 [Perkinsus olseni]
MPSNQQQEEEEEQQHKSPSTTPSTSAYSVDTHIQQTPALLLVDFDKEVEKDVEPLLESIGLRSVYVTPEPYEETITVAIAVQDYQPLMEMAESRKVVKEFIGDDEKGNHQPPVQIYYRNDLPLSRFVGSEHIETFFTKTEQLQLMHCLMKHVFNKKSNNIEMKAVWTLRSSKEQKEAPTCWGAFDAPYEKYLVPVFGCDVAQYYKLLQQYATWLLPLAGVCIFLQLCDYLSGREYIVAAITCVIVSVWATFFVESWKRLLATCRFKWCALECDDAEQQEEEEDDEDSSGGADTYLRAAVSMMGFGLMFGITVGIIIALLLLQDLAEEVSDSLIIQSLPTVAWVIVLSGGWQKTYYKLANYLTAKEKHKFYVARFESLSLKLVLFQLCNYLGWFYYVAFYRCDIDYLKNQLFIFMTVKQVFGNFQEIGLPMLMRWWSSRGDNKDDSKGQSEALESHHKTKGREHPTLKEDIDEQRQQEEYDLFDDWFEMIVDFAVCVCFGAVYPLVIPLSLIHTLTEAYNDSFKLQRVIRGVVNTDEMQMQTTRTWIDTLEIISILGVVTNVCLLYVQFTHVPEGSVPVRNALWRCVVIEHSLIALKLYLSWSIPDVPEEVAIEETKRARTPMVEDPTVEEMSVPNEIPAILATGNELHH